MTRFIGHSVSDSIGRILTMDDSVGEFLNRPVSEMIGRSFTEFTHPADIARNIRQIESIDVERKPLLIRKRYLRPDRTVLYAAVQVSRFSARTEGSRLFGTVFAADSPVDHASPRLAWAAAHRSRDAMMARRAAMGDVLFADHGWLMLIEVYLAEAEGRIVTVEALSRQLQLNPAVAWRLLRTMEIAEIVDPILVNEFAVQLTKMGAETVERLLETSVPEPFAAMAMR